MLWHAILAACAASPRRRLFCGFLNTLEPVILRPDHFVYKAIAAHAHRRLGAVERQHQGIVPVDLRREALEPGRIPFLDLANTSSPRSRAAERSGSAAASICARELDRCSRRRSRRSASREEALARRSPGLGHHSLPVDAAAAEEYYEIHGAGPVRICNRTPTDAGEEVERIKCTKWLGFRLSRDDRRSRGAGSEQQELE